MDAIGWPTFFLTTLVMGIPGLVMLARFVPPGVREPQFVVEEREAGPPLSRRALVTRGVIGGVVCGAGAAFLLALLEALKAMRATPGRGLDLWTELWRLAAPADVVGWTSTLGVVLFAAIAGLFVAAVAAARHGSFGVR